MSASDFISAHYDELLLGANNILRANRTGRQKRCYAEDSVELVQLLALHLLEMEKQPDNQLGFSLTWMKHQVNWVGTKFKKQTGLYSVSVGEDDLGASSDDVVDERAEKVRKAREARKVLSEPEKVLYDLLFSEDQPMTFREIEALVDVPQSSLHRIYAVMKNKIIDYCNKN